jgi:hypothetical protein
MFERWRAKRAMRKLPELADSIAEGATVRVSGSIVAGDDSLIAPDTGRACVAFAVRIWFAGDVGWDALAKKPLVITEVCPFAIRTDDGRQVNVVPAYDSLVLVMPVVSPSQQDRQRWNEFRDRHRLPRVKMFRAERLVEPGAVVVVAGVLTRGVAKAKDQTGFRDSAPIARLSGAISIVAA